jgi:predicted nucleotidyltransferase
MAERKISPKLIIKSYIKDLSKQIKVDGAFLFGSYATGQARENSDLDCFIISKDFQNVDFLKRLQLLSRARRGLATGVAMDIFGYTPQEFSEMKKNDSPNMQQLLKQGFFI